jgi:hypothetical protein
MAKSGGAEASTEPSLARRTLVRYKATCACGWESIESPREATVHATAEQHAVNETRISVVEPEETT